ncbi:MAG: universal stress protein [Thermaerobacter sp.]|nr:universal stress protein [Thermaerobacter sp.]
MHLQVGMLGTLIAILFVVLLTIVFSWMFRIPPLVPYEVAHIRRTVNELRTVVVPVINSLSSERAVELACRLAEPQQAQLLLVGIVEVPLSLPLDAGMPAQRLRAEEAIDVGVAICDQHELPFERVLIPARSAWEGIVRVARERSADLIVLGLDPKHRMPGEEISRNVAQVIRRVTCEVIVDRTGHTLAQPESVS